MANTKKSTYKQTYDSYMKSAKANNPYTSTSKSAKAYYEGLTNALNNQNKNTNKYYDASNEMLKNNLDTSIADTNKQYDTSARQAYIQYRQNQNALPEQLSNMGMTGGASESANLKLSANYGTSLANNESSRNSAIAGYQNTYNQNVATNEQNRNKALGENQSAYDTNKLNYDKELADKSATYLIKARQTARERALTAQTTARNKIVNSYNNKAYKKIAELERQGYKVKTWTDTLGKVHYGINGNPKVTTTSGGTKSGGGSSGGSKSGGTKSGGTKTGGTSSGGTKSGGTKKVTNTKKATTIAKWNPSTAINKIYTAMVNAKKK